MKSKNIGLGSLGWVYKGDLLIFDLLEPDKILYAILQFEAARIVSKMGMDDDLVRNRVFYVDRIPG